MSGFEAPGTGKLLNFDGTPLEGLEVRCDDAPTGLLTDIMEDYAALAGDELDVQAAVPVIRRLLESFGGVIEEWNVTRKGQPVPPTYEGLRTLGITFVLQVVGAWLTGTTEAGGELGKDSTSGTTSDRELLTAAAALSSSLPS